MEWFHNILSTSGKPWAVQSAGQPFVYFEYNPVGDNTKVYSSVADDWERNYTYDWLGRRLTYTEGEIVETLSYNGGNLSNCIQRWIENGSDRTKNTFYHYTAHRLDSVCYDDALTTIYHYDQYGRVDSLYDESGVVCYEYGNMGEVTRETRIYALPFLTNALAFSTQFTYDSWGRILNITYPDNETVKYRYDCGGQLHKMFNGQGLMNNGYIYLDSVKYDRFGAKTSQKYGNGLKTNYTYDSYTRRLTGITTMNGANTVSSFAYTYDPVGNVTQVISTNPWLPSLSFSETFTYDASDQLTAATEMQNQSYQLAVTYGNWGKVNTYDLTQTDLQSNVTQSEAQAYTYPMTNSIGSSQSLFAPELRTITDINNNVTTENLTFGINGSLRKREVFGVATYTEHYLFNSQANLKAYSNNLTDFAYYGYNASNTRTYKLGFLGGSQWVNGQPEPLGLQFQQAMFYPNAYINFNHNGEYTKHYYNGAERIASRLGNNRRTIVTGANSRLQARAAQMDELFKGQIIEMLPYEEPVSAIPDPNNGGGMSDPLYPTVEYYPIPTFTELQITGNTTDIFYYHTNHLGSTAFVTDQSRNVTQGFLYAPFGETTTEYNTTFGNDITPKYSFNAKELDEETGMYYYEARYYKPPVFTSRDPMFEKYFWMTPYAYCANNPVKYVDPSGNEAWEPDKYGNLIAEDGDNAEELSKCMGISLEEASELLIAQGYSTENVPKGSVLKLNNAFTRDLALHGNLNYGDAELYYNCWGSALAGTQNSDIAYGCGINLPTTFDKRLLFEYKAVDESACQLGKTVIRFEKDSPYSYETARNEKELHALRIAVSQKDVSQTSGDVGSASHGAVYYGTSRNGTVYVYSKNGWGAPPVICPIEYLYEFYGTVKGISGESGYYNP